MFKKKYVISGITPQLAKRWEKDFREDVKLSVDQKTRKIQGEIILTPFEAIVMRIAMRKYNLTHPCVLKLNKVKGKHFRV